MKPKTLLSVAVAIGMLGAVTPLSANLIIAIGQAGANQPVNVDAPRTWNFGVTSVGAAYFAESGLSFDTALFDAKDHKDTTAPLVFTLWSGLGGNATGNTALATVTVPASQFNQQYSGGAGKLFTFSPLILDAGYYSVTLTSTAPNDATQDYFLKQGLLTLEDSSGNALSSSLWVQDQSVGNATTTFNGPGLVSDAVALVPEVNAVWPLGIVGALSMGSLALRRGRKTAIATA